jgi:hypothetical protein
VLGLLALPDHDVSRHDLFALLASAPIVNAGGQPVPAAAWERVSREAGVVAGIRQWDERLGRLAAGLHRAGADATGAADPADDAGAALGRRARRRAAEAEDLRRYLTSQPILARPPSTWQGLAALGRDLAERYLGGDRCRASWPEAERVAHDKGVAALDRLGGLDGIDPHPTMEQFRRTLELELDADLGRVGRLGDGVFVGPVGLALGQDLDVVVVLGLAEGTFPPARPTTPLPDHGASGPAASRSPSTPVVAAPPATGGPRRRRHPGRAVLAPGRSAPVHGAPGVAMAPRRRRRLDRRAVWSHDVLQLQSPWVEHALIRRRSRHHRLPDHGPGAPPPRCRRSTAGP